MKNAARLNFFIGAGGMIAAVVAALALGITFETYGQHDGNYVFSVVRFFLRFAHTHGMPLSLYNLIVGLALLQLTLSKREARAASWGAALTWTVPLVMTAKGAAGAPEGFPHVEIIGIVGLVVSAVVLLRGAARLVRPEPVTAQS
ncbi:MAG: hypothetical protein ACRBN8_15460 [Nannocystales bacterium]